MTRPVVVLAVVALLSGCTGDPGTRDPASALLDEGDLPGGWRTDHQAVTRTGGGFCALDATMEATKPRDRSSADLVHGEMRLRHEVFAYADDEATDALHVLRGQLDACPTHPESQELGVTVRPLSDEAGVTTYRIAVSIGGVPLHLDLAAWRHDEMVGLVRLTYPSGSSPDPEGLLDGATDAALRKAAQA